MILWTTFEEYGSQRWALTTTKGAISRDMGFMIKVVIFVSLISFIVFVIFFGRLPALRYEKIYVYPSMILTIALKEYSCRSSPSFTMDPSSSLVDLVGSTND